MKYVRNAWYMAGWLKDFPSGTPIPVTLLDDPLVTFVGEIGGRNPCAVDFAFEQ